LGAVFGGALAFAAYRTTVAFVLRTPREETKVAPRRLLLLRVFGYDARTEALFDRVAQRWRFHGPVQLIAGIDLATRTIDPGDILAFLRGGLAEQYVARPSEVAERIARLDLHPDPDGRFRVNEVYCHDDTWRPALETLLEASDSVLMDLRSFSARNEGCIFELRQLLRRVRSDAIVLVVDHTTDVQRLGEILSEAWAAAVQEGRGRGDGQVALVRVERNSALELDVLMARLLGALAPQRVLNVREIAGAFT
jgi:hypothetical protein